MFLLKIFSLLVFSNFLISCEIVKENSKNKSIIINEDLYLLPGGKDSSGCTEYKLASQSGNPTILMIYYADKEGNYSSDKSTIECI